MSGIRRACCCVCDPPRTYCVVLVKMVFTWTACEDSGYCGTGTATFWELRECCDAAALETYLNANGIGGYTYGNVGYPTSLDPTCGASGNTDIGSFAYTVTLLYSGSVHTHQQSVSVLSPCAQIGFLHGGGGAQGGCYGGETFRSCGGATTSNDILYKWTHAQPDALTFSDCGEAYDCQCGFFDIYGIDVVAVPTTITLCIPDCAAYA